MAYCVVEFTQTQDLATVPSSWLSDSDSLCAWPPYKDSTRITKLASNGEKPGCSWEKFKVRCRYRTGKVKHAHCHICLLKLLTRNNLQSFCMLYPRIISES